MRLVCLHTPLIKSAVYSNSELKIQFNYRDETTNRSEARQLLWNRTVENHPFPLKTTTFATRITISTLNGMLNLMKTKVDYAQGLASGRKGTLPSLSTAKIEKVAIPRLRRLIFDGNEVEEDLDVNMAAEWVWHRDKDYSGNKAVIYIHGGAYVLSSRRTHRGITSRVSRYSGAKVLAIDYRLAPQHVFPGPLRDVLSAYQFLLDSGYAASHICFCGDSAGGALAISAMLYCRDSVGLFPLPGCVAAMSPYLDMTQSLPSWQLNEKYCYLPHEIKDDKYFSTTRSNLAVGHDSHLTSPYASPIFALSTSTRICPTLLQVGDAERVRDDTLFFAYESLDSMEPVQVEVYEDAVHVHQLFCLFDSFANHSLERLGAFIAKYTGVGTVGMGTVEEIVGMDVDRAFARSAVKVFNAPDYPVQDFPDLDRVLSDGVTLLLDAQEWMINGSVIEIGPFLD